MKLSSIRHTERVTLDNGCSIFLIITINLYSIQEAVTVKHTPRSMLKLYKLNTIARTFFFRYLGWIPCTALYH